MAEKKPKRVVLGDDAIETADADWFDFSGRAQSLARNLYQISQSSGVCCGIVGPWGSGKSSFMKLMRESVRRLYSNAYVSWFTAWDPGGISDLGDAMLYRLFYDIETQCKSTSDERKEEYEELNKIFNELQEALNLRRSIKDRARQALQIASKALPDQARVATDVAASLLELDAPRKVEHSFGRLTKWLEDKGKIVFLFVDDIDRATGEQIRDLLSELRVYVSHKKIVSVLGYDEEYVLKALGSSVLPDGIDPKLYLEKIVTNRHKLPVASYDQLYSYTRSLLKQGPEIGEHDMATLARYVLLLSSGNPRRIKSIIDTYASMFPPMKKGKYAIEYLLTGLIVSVMARSGLLADHDVLKAVEDADAQGARSAINEFLKSHPEKTEDGNLLAIAIDSLGSNFDFRVASRLRLSLNPDHLALIEVPSLVEKGRETARYDWATSFLPTISCASVKGFKVPANLARSSGELTVPHGVRWRRLLISKMGLNIPVSPPARNVFAYFSEWKETRMIILLSSDALARDVPAALVVQLFFDNCANLVSKKGLTIWVIDDCYVTHALGPTQFYLHDAARKCKGLTHPFVFAHTESGKINGLLSFLLAAGTTRKQGKLRKKKANTTRAII